MGGGDLNLKKSWHPSTFKNIERVWKVEQKHENERKKIEQLQAEIKEERSREEIHRIAVDSGAVKGKDERVDWLYSGQGTVNREEYLLGKKIDKQVDPTLIEVEREDQALASGPGALFASADTSNTTSDLASKIREDPLFIMRKKEEEAKKLLASNPVKMKQLQELLSQQMEKKKKHKSSKKSKKRRHDRDSEEEEERHHHHRGNDKDRHRMRDHSPPPPPVAHTSSRERSRSPGRPHHHSSHPHSSHHRQPSSHTKRMSQAELERRRDEMMTSAQEHKREQHARVSRFEGESRREEQDMTDKREQFLRPLRVQSLTSSHSLEDRIHRNISSVQRTKAALSDNFIPKK